MKYNKQDIIAACVSVLLVFALSFLYSDVNLERRVFICVVFGLLLLAGKGFANKWLKRSGM